MIVTKILKSSRVTLLCYLLLFCFLKAEAQVNYVKNPSFEKYDTCPYNGDQIRFAYFWSAIDSNAIIIPAYGQPEYVNECATNVVVSVPLNDRYYHFPRTGKGMAQVAMFVDSNGLTWAYQRDYLQGRFNKQLIAGKSYCVTFYAANEQQNNYAINHIGAYLDNGQIDATTHPSLPQTQYTPQILDTAIITDTLNWTKIEGSYTANGTERFITIGNYFNIPNTAHIIFNANSISSPGGAEYLIDDVSVIESDHIAFAGNDTTIALGDSAFLGEIAVPYIWYKNSGGLSLIDSTSGGIWVKPALGTMEYVVKQTLCGVSTWDSVKVTVVPVNVRNVGNVRNVLVYPNPSSGSFSISGTINDTKDATIEIFNSLGQKIYTKDLIIENEKLNIQINLDTSPGIYMLRVTTERGNSIMRIMVN